MDLSTIKNNDIPLMTLHGITTIGKVVEMYDGDTCKIVLANKSVSDEEFQKDVQLAKDIYNKIKEKYPDTKLELSKKTITPEIKILYLELEISKYQFADGGSIDDQMKDAMSKRDAIEKEIRQLMTEEPKDFDKIEALKHEYDSLGKAYKKLNKQKLDDMRGGLKFK